MKTEKTYTDDHQVKVSAEFEPELLDQFKHKAARKIAKSTRIPGFRPGKAPYPVVVTHVGEGQITQEALELMLDDVYPKVLDQEEIKPWGPGNLDNIKSENPPIFEFTIPLEPEVDLQGLENLDKEYAPVGVSDAEVEDYVTRMRRSYATIVPLETPAAENNVVYLSLEGTDLNPAEDAEPVVVKSSSQQVLIPTDTEEQAHEWPFQGFARSLIGRNAEEEFELTHTYPADSDDKELAGKTVRFDVKIQSVKGLELPEIDEEFLKNAGGFPTVEDMYKGVRSHLETDKQQAYDDTYYQGLVDQLREASVIKYPPQMLAEEEEQVLHRIEHDLSHRQLNLDLYLKLRKTDRDTFLAEEVKPTAILRLERSLVMEAITRKYDLKVSKEALESEISNVINNLVASGEFVEMQKEMGSKQFAESVSMEAANRAMEKSIRDQLRSIASPEAIEVKAPEAVLEAAPEKKPRKATRKAKAEADVATDDGVPTADDLPESQE